MKRITLTGLALGLAATTLVAPAWAQDVLVHKDGRILRGPKMERDGDFIIVHMENGDLKVPAADLEMVAITGEEDFVPETEEEKEKYAKGLVPFEGKWIQKSKRDKIIERRLEEQLEQVEDDLAHNEWGTRRSDTSKNFRWDYTIPEHIKEAFVARCESYYEQFCKDWRVKRSTKKPRMMINFFSNANEFRQVGGAGGGALAYFMFLGDYDLCVFYDRLDFEFTEMVLYHELSHYLQKLLNEEFKMPHWPGEGLSEYYGGALWNTKTKSLDMGLTQEGRLASVRNDIAVGDWITLKDTVMIDQFEDYSWGWTLVHFFMNHKKYEKGFKKYVNGLANDRGVKRTVGSFNLKFVSPQESLRYLMECLKIKDEEELKEVEEEWYEYIQNDLVLSGASGLEKEAQAVLQLGKRIKAKRLFQEAIDAGTTNPVTYYKFAQLVRYDDRSKAIDLLERAIELDPLTAVFWYQLSKLKARGDEEEGERLKALAKELDPNVDANDFDLYTDGEEDTED